jgi:peptidoglycan hydrolase-like protein with peptidoglycan-binding domain
VLAPPEVPRAREIWKEMRGDDVVAVKRALSRAGYMRWGTFSPVWGAGAIAAVRPFQKDHGVPPGPGTYGPLTHAALVATHARGSDTQWAYDGRAIALMKRFCTQLVTRPDSATRAAVVGEAARLYAHRNEIDYVEVERPVALKRPPAIPDALDCSLFVTACYFAGGALDPNGFHYSGFGYTGSLITTGRRCTIHELEPGDLVFYGSTPADKANETFPVGSPTHVALFDGTGVYSPGGPNRNDRMRYHEKVDYRTINHCRHYDFHA